MEIAKKLTNWALNMLLENRWQTKWSSLVGTLKYDLVLDLIHFSLNLPLKQQKQKDVKTEYVFFRNRNSLKTITSKYLPKTRPDHFCIHIMLCHHDIRDYLQFDTSCSKTIFREKNNFSYSVFTISSCLLPVEAN